MPPSAVLTLQCDDRPGIVASVASLIAATGGNIMNADQHTDRDSNVFLQRIEIDGPIDWSAFEGGLRDLVDRDAMRWSLHRAEERSSMVIACSSQLHCVADLLSRVRLGELDVDVLAVVSDRTDAEELATMHGIPFVPVVGGLSGDDRSGQERAFAEALDRFAPDLVVLARYMRILPASITDRWSGRMINIHHSFLPAFPGARPYHRAHQRGVKVIGATAHYVTAELDEGPIIAQGVAPVSHRDEVEDLVRIGRDVERKTLADAVRLHLEHRVLVWDNRTCVFA